MTEVRAFVMSLARLYKDGKITKTKLNTLLKDKKISQEEFDYIIAFKNA
jgi:hypothetical protein